MLSIVIPSRDPRWLQKTIDDLLLKSRGEIEVIVLLDGYSTELKDDPRVRVIHQGMPQDSLGMREGINAGMRISRGEWVMKCDEHTMWDEGFDLKLIEDCDEETVVVPRRLRLDPEKWELIEDPRPPIDYMYLEYPYRKPYEITEGLHGMEWRQKYYDRKDVLIDDLMTFQGSAYFMHKKHWEWLGELNSALYGSFTHESQEISNKTWLGGRRVIVNKKTWYAHLHKGKQFGTGYNYSNAQWRKFALEREKGRKACIDYWVNNKWEDRKYDFKWLIEKFWPMPGWMDNWQEQIELDKGKDYSARADAKYQESN